MKLYRINLILACQNDMEDEEISDAIKHIDEYFEDIYLNVLTTNFEDKQLKDIIKIDYPDLEMEAEFIDYDKWYKKAKEEMKKYE